jgi:VWFA-related protein
LNQLVWCAKPACVALLALAAVIVLSGGVYQRVDVVSAASRRQQSTQPAPTAAQQRPVFRGGTHFVRVDAYPIQDGKIVEGLEAEDFEVLEDGKPQKIDSFDFIKFDTVTPEVARRDPRSQREGFDLAADPRYRLFVLFVHVKSAGIQTIRQPLINFLDRVLGPGDLFGLLTSRNSAKDLVLGQQLGAARAAIDDLWRSSFIDRDDADELDGCGMSTALTAILQERSRVNDVYTGLETLVAQLGSLRQERKNIIVIANDLSRAGPDTKLLERRGAVLPRAGLTNGRIGTGESGSRKADETMCAGELQRLAQMDFDARYRELLREARKQNVTFYAITPAGLQAPFTREGMTAVNRANDSLITLANETDGLAIVNTNDLQGGMRRIADDLAAYYVLGYYTTNTTFDGGIRNIKVRLKASGVAVRARRQYRAPTQEEIAALAAGPAAAAPGTAASRVEMATPVQNALTVLERASTARAFGTYVAVAGNSLTVVAELSAASVQANRWKDGADVEVLATGAGGEPAGAARARLEPGARSAVIKLPLSGAAWPDHVSVTFRGPGQPPSDDWVKLGPRGGALVGDAVAYRSAPRAVTSPVGAFEFVRNERVRLEWPVLGGLDRREARLLDRLGKPFPIDLPISEDASKGAAVLVTELPLAALKGDYVIELTAGGGGATEHRLTAIRVK